MDFVILFTLLIFRFLSPWKHEPEPYYQLPWVVYYNDETDADAFLPYNPIIFDSEHHPALTPLLEANRSVLGYLNIGEAEDRHEWFQEIKKSGLLISENPDWKGSWSVDIRSPKWTELLLSKVIPAILSQGFTGLFFDQVDVSLDLEVEDEKQYAGMKQAAVQLLKAIRHKYPTIDLMLNRGYEILPEVGSDINFVLAETLYSYYDFVKQKYVVRPRNEYLWQLTLLNQARFIHPRLTIFSLDYWDPDDQEMVSNIYSIEHAQGIRPYVSTPILDRIFKWDK